MFEYLIGKIVYKNSKFIIVENNNMGYKIFVVNPNDFELNNEYKLFIYQKIGMNNKNNQIFEMYGFKNIFEKFFFENLLSIIGVGTKTSLQIMVNDLNLLKSLIVERKINDLCNLENINKKLAFSLVNQLSFKLSSLNYNNNVNETSCENKENIVEIIAALKSLGYKKEEINYAINSLKDEQIEDVNEAISLAIKNIVNKNDKPIIEA